MKSVLREMIYMAADDSWLTYYVDTMLLASVLICILLLIRSWMKRLPRIGMYLMWVALGLRLMIPMDLFHFLPHEFQREVETVAHQMGVHTVAAKLQLEELDQFGGRENGYRLSQGDLSPVVSEGKAGENVMTPYTGEYEQAKKGIEILMTLWALGMIFLLIYMFESMLWVRLRLCDAKLVDENVFTHPLVYNSFVVGWSNPRIYLSERVEEGDRQTILYHERVHIRRWDQVTKRLMFLLCAVFWVNPLMWVAYRYMVEDMEISCDEAVLRKFGEHKRKYYSVLLLQMSAVNSGYRKQYAGFCAGTVGRRIRSILNYQEHGKIFYCVCMIFTCCVMGWILSVPGVQAWAGQAQPVKTVYVEQSFGYPDGEEGQEDKKDAIYLFEGRLYTCLTDQGQVCGVAKRCGDKWLEERQIPSGLWQHIMAQENVQHEGNPKNQIYVGEGDGFYVMLQFIGNMPCELTIFNWMTGREQYGIPLEAYLGDANEQGRYNFQVGVSGDRIYFVCDKGIFETIYGKQEIHRMVSEADNVYYLSDDQSEYCDIIRGTYDDYYVAVRRGGERFICHYGLRKVRVIR